MCLSVSYGALWSLTISPITWSCYMSFTVSSTSMELLHVSHSLRWLLAFSPTVI